MFEGAPTWRPDLEREIDLVEEVGRRYGLNRIARTRAGQPRRGRPADAPPTGAPARRRRARRRGLRRGLHPPAESPTDLDKAGQGGGVMVEVENPLRAEESILRPSALPGLLRAVGVNEGFGNSDLALFELGVVFRGAAEAVPAKPPLADERDHVTALRAGAVRRRPHESDRLVDVYDAVAAVEAIADALRLADLQIRAGEAPGFHPSRVADVLVDGVRAGAVGEIAPEVLAALDLAGPVVGFDLDVAVLVGGRRKPARAPEVSRYPASGIDLAFVVDDSVPVGDVMATLNVAGGDLLEQLHAFDVFRSGQFGPGKVSIAFSLRFRASDRTLTDEEVADVRAACIAAVERAHGALLR